MQDRWSLLAEVCLCRRCHPPSGRLKGDEMQEAFREAFRLGRRRKSGLSLSCHPSCCVSVCLSRCLCACVVTVVVAPPYRLDVLTSWCQLTSCCLLSVGMSVCLPVCSKHAAVRFQAYVLFVSRLASSPSQTQPMRLAYVRRQSGT